jgi:hypothetical protein
MQSPSRFHAPTDRSDHNPSALIGTGFKADFVASGFGRKDVAVADFRLKAEATGSQSG